MKLLMLWVDGNQSSERKDLSGRLVCRVFHSYASSSHPYEVNYHLKAGQRGTRFMCRYASLEIAKERADEYLKREGWHLITESEAILL